MENKGLVDFLKENKVEVTIVNGAIRVWKLGDHTVDPPILPKKIAAQKLLSILKECDEIKSGIDIVWDSMISVQVLDNDEDTIKLWKLGDSAKNILPKQTAADKLKDMIRQQGIKGPNIVWDNMIEAEHGIAV